MTLKYTHLEDPRMLEGRFEQGFPLVYIGDKVIGSSRWAGDGENPQKGKVGQVVRIKHGLQSLFNRDYLIVGMAGNDGYSEAWLYTLDLAERNPRNLELFKSGQLVYIDDRIEVVSTQHPRFGATGNVKEILGHNEPLLYKVRDDSVSDQIIEVERGLADRIDVELQRRLSDSGAYSKFKSRIKGKDQAGYGLLEREGNLRKMYDVIVRKEVVKRLTARPQYRERRQRLDEVSMVLVGSSSVRLIEVFPPNRLFRVE